MKRLILILLALLGFTAGGWAQGQVFLANNSSSLVYILNPTNLATAGSVFLQLYAASGSNQPQGALIPIGPVVGINSLNPGQIEGTIINVPQAPNGESATFQIWVWSTPFATRQEAFNGGGLVGASILFTANTSFQKTGFPPPIPVSLVGKFPSFGIIPIPEPSTTVLGIMGLGSLLIFRRKR
jgi:hypothetical protein